MRPATLHSAVASRFILSVLCLCVFVGAGCGSAFAASSWFKKFSTSSFVSNAPSAWESQKMGHYSGGGISLRTPVDRTPFFTITPPRIEAGCGGIDAFWGGFSFLNPEFLIQKLKNILQAAPAFAFKLALQQLCPPCDKILQDLEDIANMLNGLALDDCQAARVIAGAGVNFFTSSIGLKAHEGDKSGTGVDYQNTMIQYMSDGLTKFQTELKSLIDHKFGCKGKTGAENESCRAKYTIEGFFWDLVQVYANSENNTDNLITDDFKKLARAMYGDIYFKDPGKKINESNDKGASIGIVSIVEPCPEAHKQFIDAILDMTDSNLPVQYKEAETSNGLCATKTLKEFMGAHGEDLRFGYRAREAVKDVRAKLVTGAALEPDTLEVIRKSVVPIYQALNILNLQAYPGKNALGGSIVWASTGPEGRIAEMAAAGNALYMLHGYQNSVNAAINDYIVFVSAVIEQLKIYEKLPFENAVIFLRHQINRVDNALMTEIERTRRNFFEHMKEHTNALTLRKMFQTIVANRMHNRF